MTITVIGTGFVGVVSAAVYASQGNRVFGLDIDEKKVESLRNSQVTFFEPGLPELLTNTQSKEKLTFTTNYAQAVKDSELIIIAVGTPSTAEGSADLRYVLNACQSLAPHLKENAIVAVKSTVPPGTLDKVESSIKQLTSAKFYTASLPEFLKEGSAVEDTLHPDRIVIGATDQFVFETLDKVHQAFDAPIVKVSPASAQMAKYSANAYLATRITFINQVSDLCQKNGADIEEVIEAISLDKRIGRHYWYPGFGYGGSCFPKDVKELAAYSRTIGESGNLFNKVNELNQERLPKLLNQYSEKVGGWQDKQIAVLGLAFKPNTDDMREAPATILVPLLSQAGAKISSYDPQANWEKYGLSKPENFVQVGSVAEAVVNADVIFCLIEWSEITQFDFSAVKQVKRQWLIDARNQFDPQLVNGWGYEYLGVGR